MPEACSHSESYLARSPDDSKIFYWCPSCKRNVSTAAGFPGTWIKKTDPRLKFVEFEDLPVVGEQINRLCQGPCKRITVCQVHHVAPRHLFGEAADDWPIVWLCKSCHAEWHRIVTPAMCSMTVND